MSKNTSNSYRIHLKFTTEIDASQEAVWAFYDSLETLKNLSPPGTRVWIPHPPEKLVAGSRFVLWVSQPPIFIPLPWESVMSEREPPHRFVDIQPRFRGPFWFWEHTHTFEKLENSENKTLLTDSIEYEVPLGIIGSVLNNLFIQKSIENAFAYRHQKTKECLEKS
jgi:ligand-binding SRPBCC domain-containing protein